MNRNVFFALMLIVPVTDFADNGSNPALVMKSLLEKQKKIGSFEGFFSDITMTQGRPMIDISFVKGAKDSTFPLPVKKESTLVMTIRPLSVPVSQRISAMEEAQGLMSFFKSFTPTSTTVQKPGQSEDGIIQFNYFDKNKTLRESRWFDSGRGFEVAYAYYFPDGTLASMDFYSFVKFNESVNLHFDPDNVKHASFERLTSKLNNFNVNSIQGLTEFINEAIKIDIFKSHVHNKEWHQWTVRSKKH